MPIPKGNSSFTNSHNVRMFGKLEAALKDKDAVIDSLQSENTSLRKQLQQLQSQHRGQSQRCRQLEDTVVTLQGLVRGLGFKF